MSGTDSDGQAGGAGGLPRGLRWYEKRDRLESVASSSVAFSLLVSGDGTEVITIRVNKGEQMVLVPDERASGLTETFFVLQGRLRYLGGEPRILGPHDYVVSDGLRGPVNLIADEDTSVLYIASRPVFHEISHGVEQLMRLAREIEQKDGYTSDHCKRIQNLSHVTGLELSLSPQQLYLLDYGAYLHDLGKIKVPLAILQKPAALSDEEWRIVRQHPTFGREMLDPTFMKDAGPIVEQHHERSDGSGYPYGLVAGDVLTESAIVAVADTYDAMTTDRPYRRALPPEAAFAELSRYAGVHYPREVVRAFVSAVERSGLDL